MSYTANTLGTKERIRYRTGYHWLYWAAAYVLAAPAFAVILGGYPFGALDFTLGAVALIALPFGLFMLVRAYATEIAVTSERFVAKHGLVSYEADEIGLDAIEEINIDESVLGRLLGFARIEVHGAGNANIGIDFVWRPERLRREIHDARRALAEGEQTARLAIAA